nr:uncharacterized protein LOC110091754 [Pogona vitticeps]
MAPPPPRRAEPVASEAPENPSALLLGSLASVAPVILTILLLLLCFHFKSKKRQFSTGDPTRDRNTSVLLRMIGGQNEPNAGATHLENGGLCQGSSPVSCRPERPTNGTVAAEFHQRSANSQTETPTMSRASPKRFAQRRKMEVDHLRGTAPQRLCPRAASPSALQFRKLPMTPKEAHVPRIEPLNQDADNEVYESICDEARDPGAGVCMESRKGADSTTRGRPNSAGEGAPSAESTESAGMTVACGSTTGQPAAHWQHIEFPSELPGVASEQGAPHPVAPDTEKRLSAMYARVRKRPKAFPQQEPGKPAEQEVEEEPPPIPEKHFEDIYESLSVDAVGQDGMRTELTVPSEA